MCVCGACVHACIRVSCVTDIISWTCVTELSACVVYTTHVPSRVYCSFQHVSYMTEIIGYSCVLTSSACVVCDRDHHLVVCTVVVCVCRV